MALSFGALTFTDKLGHVIVDMNGTKFTLTPDNLAELQAWLSYAQQQQFKPQTPRNYGELVPADAQPEIAPNFNRRF